MYKFKRQERQLESIGKQKSDVNSLFVDFSKIPASVGTANEFIPLMPDIDIAIHHNIVRSYAPVTIATEPSMDP